MNSNQSSSSYELGDWLPITWIPNTPDEIEYMEFVRAKVAKEHDKYIAELKLKYNK